MITLVFGHAGSQRVIFRTQNAHPHVGGAFFGTLRVVCCVHTTENEARCSSCSNRRAITPPRATPAFCRTAAGCAFPPRRSTLNTWRRPAPRRRTAVSSCPTVHGRLEQYENQFDAMRVDWPKHLLSARDGKRKIAAQDCIEVMV